MKSTAKKNPITFLPQKIGTNQHTNNVPDNNVGNILNRLKEITDEDVAKKRISITKRQITRELKSKRSKTKLYWYIVAINRETKKRWYWDVTEGEWIGKPNCDNCAFVDWDYAYNLGILYGMTPSDLKKNDVYIVHAGIAEFIGIDSADEPYPNTKFIRKD